MWVTIYFKMHRSQVMHLYSFQIGWATAGEPKKQTTENNRK